MTTLDLTKMCLAPASDLTDVLLLGQYAESSGDSTMVDVRRYANGRDRVISTPGSSVSVSVSFRYVSRANFASMQDLVGSMVLFRDQRTRRVWGVFGDLSATELSQQDLLEDVSFTLTSATVSEVV